MTNSNDWCRILRPGHLCHTRKNNRTSLLAERQKLVPGSLMMRVSRIGCPQSVPEHCSVQEYVSYNVTMKKDVLTKTANMQRVQERQLWRKYISMP